MHHLDDSHDIHLYHVKNSKPVKHALAMPNKLPLWNDTLRKLTLNIENIQFHKIGISGIQFFLVPLDQTSSFFFQGYAMRFNAVTWMTASNSLSVFHKAPMQNLQCRRVCCLNCQVSMSGKSSKWCSPVHLLIINIHAKQWSQHFLTYLFLGCQ